MPIPVENYATLIASTIDYLDRPSFEDDCEGFIRLAESRFNGMLRAREMEKTAVIGNAVATAALPVDFLEWITVTWLGSGREASPTFAEADSPEARYRHRPGGDPQYFVVTGDAVRLVPAKPGAITLSYYALIPGLSQDNDTNWLIGRAPDAYLYATIAEGYVFMKEPELAQAHLQIAMQALGAAGIKADNQKLTRRPGRDVELAAAGSAAARPE